jgi:parvulin-like peptidyl-prolyl isomerase
VAGYLLLRDDPAQDPATILARVGDEQITVAEFREEMRIRGGGIPGQYRSVEQRQALLDLMIDQRLLVAGAKSSGYLEDEEVQRLIEKILVNKYFEEELRQRLDAVIITDEDVAAHYQENINRHIVPSQRRGAIIRVAWPNDDTPERRLAVMEQLMTVRGQVETALDENVTHFGQLARQHSDDRASRFQGGVIGWVEAQPARPYRGDDVVLEGLFDLAQPGEIAGPLEGKDGAYLVRLVGIKPESTRPLSRVADGIRHALNNNRRDQVRAEFLAEIRQSVPIKIHSQHLEAIRPLSGPAVADQNKPPTTPAG